MPVVAQRPVVIDLPGGPHVTGLTVTNQGPAIAYYAANESVSTSSAALAVSASITITARTVFICAPGTSTTLAVADVVPPSAQSSSIDATGYGVRADGTDQATKLQTFLNALRDAGPGARGTLPPGTIVTAAPLLIDSLVNLRGAGRNATTLKLADGTNGGAPVLKTRNFDLLTGTGSNTQGEGSFSVAELAIDGNKANNASGGHGLAIFGYQFALDAISIRNANGDGLFTEWGKLGTPGADGSMESDFTRLLIDQCNGNGWHYRGPHDSMFSGVKIQRNAGIGLWLEAQGANTVDVGSNGVDVATFAGAGVLNVATATVGYPTAGTLTVATSSGTAQITYTGKTQNTFTGLTRVSGTGTLSTGGAVNATSPYSGTGLIGSAMHIWGTTHTVALQADNGLFQVASGIFEGAQTGQVWLRSAGCALMGGKIFGGQSTPPGYGLKLGDTNYTATNNLVDTLIGDQDFQGLAAATASVDFASSGSNVIRGKIKAGSGSAHITGTPSATDTVDLVASGQSQAINAGNSLHQTTGGGRQDIGTGSFAFQSQGADSIVVLPGRLRFPSTTPPAIAGVTAAIGTSGNGMAVSLTGNDRRGTITITTASTGIGSFPATVANVTYGTAWPGTPRVLITPMDGKSAALLPYAQAFSTTQFLFGFNGAPAASTTYTFNYLVEG